MYSRLFRVFCLVILLSVTPAGGSRPASALFKAQQTAQSAAGYPIHILQGYLQLSGDVTTQGNCTASTATCDRVKSMPDQSVLLGVRQNSASFDDGSGGSMTASLTLPDDYQPTRLTLKVAWPAESGFGLRSMVKNRAGSIWLDGQPLWSQRVVYPMDGAYFANNGTDQILTTIVVRGTGTHTLQFRADANTEWDISEILLTASAAPADILGVGYSPYRDCQMPGSSALPTLDEVQEDLFRLSNSVNTIRTYSALGINASVPQMALARGLDVFAGAWLDYPYKGSKDLDQSEVDSLKQMVCDPSLTNLKGVIVGNEYYLRNKKYANAIEDLSGYIDQVKNSRNLCGSTVPVTTAEIDSVMFNFNGAEAISIKTEYRPIIDQVDFVMVHLYPFWGQMPVTGAADFAVRRYLSIQKLLNQTYPGKNKWVIIGETGWPSGGAPQGQAVPSLTNQRLYLLDLLKLAEANHVRLLYFDGFDELWKLDEPGGVGQHWGYGYADRSAKYDFYGIYLPAADLSMLHYRYQTFLPNVSRSGSAGVAPAGQVQSLPVAATMNAAETQRDVYSEWPERAPEKGATLPDPQKFFVPSGWMGDLDDIEMYGCDRSDPHGGEMATRVSYAAEGSKGWAGGVWQYPENNWGAINDNINLGWANKITFWAKGAQGGEKVRFFAGGLGVNGMPYPDSLQPEVSSGYVTLTLDWQQYTINLVGKDLSHVIGGFGWVADRCADPYGATFYLDDIIYAYEPNLQPPPPEQPLVVYRDAGVGSNPFVPSGWMGDIENITINECDATTPHSGQTAIRATADTCGANGWVGVIWQYPDSNWGDFAWGRNLSWANKITFYARGDQGGEKVRFFAGGVGPKGKPYPDSIQPEAATPFITLTKQWQPYIINLVGKDLSHVIAGFGWMTDKYASGSACTQRFYLDDIQYEYEPNLPPPQIDHPFVIYRDAGSAANHYASSGWMGEAETQPNFLTETWTTDPYSGSSAIRVQYTNQGGWAGAYWLYPAENWGDQPGGYDLSGAKRVTFYARTDSPGAQATFFLGGVGYDTDYLGEPLCGAAQYPYPDSLCPRPETTVTLTSQWTKYTITIPSTANLTRVVGGFGFKLTSSATMYLDEIVYEFE